MRLVPRVREFPGLDPGRPPDSEAYRDTEVCPEGMVLPRGSPRQFTLWGGLIYNPFFQVMSK